MSTRYEVLVSETYPAGDRMSATRPFAEIRLTEETEAAARRSLNALRDSWPLPPRHPRGEFKFRLLGVEETILS